MCNNNDFENSKIELEIFYEKQKSKRNKINQFKIKFIHNFYFIYIYIYARW